MGTMVNGGEPGAIFHANPGHGTAKESKSPPNGRASGTVRRSINGKDCGSIYLYPFDFPAVRQRLSTTRDSPSHAWVLRCITLTLVCSLYVHRWQELDKRGPERP